MSERNGQLQEYDDPQPGFAGGMASPGAVPRPRLDVRGRGFCGLGPACRAARRDAVEDVKAAGASGVGYSAQFG